VTLFRATNEHVRRFWRVPPIDSTALDGARAELARYLPVLERALAGRAWLEGDLTLADLAYAPHLKLVIAGGYDLSATPAVRDWLARLWARPAWQRAERLVFEDADH
jgi:glutathione S-transferase